MPVCLFKYDFWLFVLVACCSSSSCHCFELCCVLSHEDINLDIAVMRLGAGFIIVEMECPLLKAVSCCCRWLMIWGSSMKTVLLLNWWHWAQDQRSRPQDTDAVFLLLPVLVMMWVKHFSSFIHHRCIHTYSQLAIAFRFASVS